MGKIILVTSGKGGVGTSTVAVNLAATYAKNKESVVLVDLAFGRRNLDLYLGMEDDAVYDMGDVLSGAYGLERVLSKDSRFESLYLLKAPMDRTEVPEETEEYIEILNKEFDKVIIDLPAGSGALGKVFRPDGMEAVVVSSPDNASVRNTSSVVEKLLGKPEIGVRPRDNVKVVINRIIPDLMNENVVPKLRDIAPNIRAEIIGVMQEDNIIGVSTNLGIPVVLKDGTYIEKNFKDIAGRL